MYEFLYLLIPCLSLALLILMMQIMYPVFNHNQKKEIEKAKIKWIKLLNNEKKYLENLLLIKYGRYIKKTNYLIAFSILLKDENYKEKCTNALMKCSKVFCNSLYKEKDNIIAGFFCHIISKLDMSKFTPSAKEDYCYLTFHFSTKRSVYCHENALQVFYAFGDINFIIQSYKHFTNHHIYHNEKLLSDGLMTFKGDKIELAKALVENKDLLAITYQIAIVQFLSAENIHTYDEIFIEELATELNLDYRCSILRLLGKDKCMRNRNILFMSLKQHANSDTWQLGAVAANGLSLYEDDKEVIQEVAKACCSPHWSVRLNSANTLVKIDTTGDTAKKVISGKDKFASDAVTYALTVKEAM